MTELPSGTVTFLFTDVEGSTRLLAEHGDAYAELLAEHRRLLREAFARHGGVEVDTQGDAFFYAFARASDALVAAEEGRQALEPTPVRVRVGVHTGEPTPTDEGYVGVDVHTAARIAAAGHGGQVLVSERTAGFLEPGNSLLLADLGLHRLKDLGRPLRLYQLGKGEFPSLRSLHATNVPVPATPLVGRKKELADVLRLLRVEQARLVTLTGPGGIGKTRFAVAVAAEVTESYAHGVWLVDLSSLRDAALVVPTIGRTLGADGDVASYLAARQLLLVLDNVEQITASAPALASLLEVSPGVQILATSREPLRVSGEREYPLRPLPESPAIELFRERASAANPDFDAPYGLVAAICERLDRLPLALELAAARVRVLEPADLLARLDRRLPLLATRRRDVPERQRTLADTITWSYELLAADEQMLFARLAIFVGGWTLVAAERVAGADLDQLEPLVEKSLVQRRGERFTMLGTIREFALDRLDESGESHALRRCHAEYFLELADGEGIGMEPASILRQAGVVAAIDDIRAALDWAREHDPELGLRLAVALEGFWVVFDPLEALRLFEPLLERGRDVPLAVRAHALRAYGSAANPAGRDDLAERAYAESLHAFRALGDEAAANVLLLRLGYAALYRGDLARARALAEETLEGFVAAGDRLHESQSHGLLGEVEYAQGNHEAGIRLIERSATMAGETHFTWWRARMLGRLVDFTLEHGDLDAASAHAREALVLSRELADRLRLVRGLARLAVIAAENGDEERAGRLWGAVEAEEARGPVGAWESERERYEERVLSVGADDLQRGRVAGQSLSLDEAMAYALGDLD